MNCLKDNQGLVLIVMVFTLAIISLLGVSLLSASLRENIIADYQEDSVSARYIAEYGLQRALASLRGHPDWKSDPYWNDFLDVEIPFDEGFYTLTFNEKDSNILEIVSTGKNRDAESVIKADVRITKVNKAFEDLALINSDTYIIISGNADVRGDIYSGSDLNFNGALDIRGNITCLGKTTINDNYINNIKIDGSIYSGDDIVIGAKNFQIDGNIYGRGNLTFHEDIKPNKINGTIQINGNINPPDNYNIIYGGVEQREPKVFPKLDAELLESYRQAAQKDGNYYSNSSVFLQDYQLSGTTFVNSPVTINDNLKVEGQGVLVINGSLTVSGNAHLISKGGVLVVIVNGDITLSGNQKVECVLFNTGYFMISGQPNISGNIITNYFSGSGNFDIRQLDKLEDGLPKSVLEMLGDTSGVSETKVEVLSIYYE